MSFPRNDPNLFPPLPFLHSGDNAYLNVGGRAALPSFVPNDVEDLEISQPHLGVCHHCGEEIPSLDVGTSIYRRDGELIHLCLKCHREVRPADEFVVSVVMKDWPLSKRERMSWADYVGLLKTAYNKARPSRDPLAPPVPARWVLAGF
jgi:hypothetical protein